MSGFNFEKNLEHQSKAVKSVVRVFDGLDMRNHTGAEKEYINPTINIFSESKYSDNIKDIQEENSINQDVKNRSNIIDVMMETGTGKTYTYTKTMFELNKQYGIFKFVI